MPSRPKAKSSPAKAVDQQLERYRSMRDFSITSEPKGDAKVGKPSDDLGLQPFVVQKHAATRLHYDFRLGWNGVLKSWAVTKGPSYFLGDKRLAVEVEDHPMEYGGFEGTIPKGQYGGGTVMIWDHGQWKGVGNVEQEFQKGNLKFELYGTKLRGKWALGAHEEEARRSIRQAQLVVVQGK
jgi:bifunctional non-homologous end joining protein LigD